MDSIAHVGTSSKVGELAAYRLAAYDGARHLKKSDGVLRQGISVKYAWIAKHKTCWPITLACEVLGVSASGYFEHWRRKDADKPSRPGANKRISDEALLVLQSQKIALDAGLCQPDDVRATLDRGSAARQKVRIMGSLWSADNRGKVTSTTNSTFNYERDTARVVLDNHSAHISKETMAWLAHHPGRFEYVHSINDR